MSALLLIKTSLFSEYQTFAKLLFYSCDSLFW